MLQVLGGTIRVFDFGVLPEVLGLSALGKLEVCVDSTGDDVIVLVVGRLGITKLDDTTPVVQELSMGGAVVGVSSMQTCVVLLEVGVDFWVGGGASGLQFTLVAGERVVGVPLSSDGFIFTLTS